MQFSPDGHEGSHELVLCDSLPVRDQRTIVFYLLYMAEVSAYEVSIDSIADQFGRGYFCTINPDGSIASRARAIVEKRNELDAEIRPLLQNWKLERLSLVTKLILRLALWELQHTDLDVAVVINEALELSKTFAEADAYKFVNGVLDEWVKRNRPSESKIIDDKIPEDIS